MNTDRKSCGERSWYCARTKPKHEHIAAANISRTLGLEVFHPRLRMEKATRRGVVRLVEPLFPCYIFLRCVIENHLDDIRYVAGISSLVHFGQRIPPVPDGVIADLKECFHSEEPMTVDDGLLPGAEVTIATGAFLGSRAIVLQVFPAKRRVQVLLDILGRSTLAEVDRCSVASEIICVADLVPALANIRN